MENVNEKLLRAWLKLSIVANNERLVSDMPYNEALICNILYENEKCNPEKRVTATDLCRKTKMLKSQMNRTLNSLEKKGIIMRQRSSFDKRQVFVFLNLKESDIYHKQHEKILKLLDVIVETVGEEKIADVIELFIMVSDALEGVM